MEDSDKKTGFAEWMQMVDQAALEKKPPTFEEMFGIYAGEWEIKDDSVCDSDKETLAQYAKLTVSMCFFLFFVFFFCLFISQLQLICITHTNTKQDQPTRKVESDCHKKLKIEVCLIFAFFCFCFLFSIFLRICVITLHKNFFTNSNKLE